MVSRVMLEGQFTYEFPSVIIARAFAVKFYKLRKKQGNPTWECIYLTHNGKRVTFNLIQGSLRNG